MNNIGGLIGIARKAGFLIIGGENLSHHTKKLYLILVDKTAGNSLKREMEFLSSKREINLIEIDGLENYVGIKNCKAVGIKNKAFSDNIEKCLKGE